MNVALDPTTKAHALRTPAAFPLLNGNGHASLAPRPAAGSVPNLLAEFKAATILNAVRRCEGFAGLPEASLQELAALTTLKWLAKGEYLFHEADPVAGLYVVHQGAIKVSRVSHAGHEQIMRIYRPTECFAEEALLSESGHTADACAVEPAHVLLIQKAGIVTLLRRESGLVLCLLKSMSRHFDQLVQLLNDLTLTDVKTRLARWLVEHCPDPESDRPVRIELAMSKRLLAAELGAASETFSRTLGKLRDQKLLTIDGKYLTLLAPRKLARLCGWSGPARTPKAAVETADHNGFFLPVKPVTPGAMGNGVPGIKRRTTLVIAKPTLPSCRLPKKTLPKKSRPTGK
ncbi:MAG: Crp/Fnr family transcriptional regulator [Verrucomicrobia bacterium]|nr:Crp/Fnr family transcriptional regulator [Verrucomicrobiota bacterium]